MSARLVGAEAAPDDLDTGLRPRRLAEFIGQAQLRENLAVFIEAARGRNEALDHLLFAGPPGLGKTTLAQIVAAELGVGFRMTSGPIIARAGDLAAILTNLQPRDVLFIDEIHRLSPVIEEVLYPAMEDFQLDLMIGEGPAARSVTDRPAALHPDRRHHPDRPPDDAAARPLRHPCPARLLCRRGAAGDRPAGRRTCCASISPRTVPARSPAVPGARPGSPPACCAACATSRRSTARVPVDATLADRALRRLEVDGLGLDRLDRRYLEVIATGYGGGPVGIETISAALSEQRDTLEETIEPFLLQQGLLQRTPRGRLLTRLAWRHLDLEPPRDASPQPWLFDGPEQP